MKSLCLWLAVFSVAGCKSSIDSKEAVRQGVIEHLSSRSNLNISSMDVDVSSVSFRQNEADAMVSFSPKGGASGQGMSMRYTLERQGGKWVVKSKADSGQNPHGAPPSAMPQGHPPVKP